MNKKSVMTIIVGAIIFSVIGVIVSFRRFAPPLFYTSIDNFQTTGIEHFILVISDGMSWERLNDLDPPNITRMISTGAAATHGISEVPSVTITNKITIPSGAHASTHGVVENIYLKRNAVSVDTIQEAVERDGLTYEELTSATAIVNAINSGTLANYTLWWSGDVDSAGHHYGHNSSQYVDAIYSIDTGIGQIMSALESTNLDEVTILGLGSDHGMQDLLPEGKSAPDTAHILDLRSILENAEFIVDKWRASGPRMGHVFLADPSSAASAKAILEATPGIERAFTKSELDGADLGGDMIAYLNHKKSGDVIAFAEAEFSMGRSVIQSPADGLDNPSKYYWDGSNDYRGGHGGLTTMEQYVPFIVWGEAIEPNCSLGPRYNVDWAPTIAAFFEIDPPNDSEGTAVLDCLRSR